MLLIFPVLLSVNLLATGLGFTLPIGVVKPAEDSGSKRELTDAFVTAFDAADSDGDNQLSAKEFPRAVAVTFNVSSSAEMELPRMGHVFHEIDANHDGLISREEEKEFILNKEESLDKLVFALFDQNEDGRLNVTEVTALFGDLFHGEETSDLVGQLIREFDENADGELEVEELFGEGANGTRTGNGEQTSTTTLAPQTSTSTMNIYEAISHAHATLNQSRNATEWKSRILSLLFHKADSNSDGKITPDEFERFVALASLSSGGRPNGDESAREQLATAKVAFQLADLNGDGHLTKEEFLTGNDGDFSEEKAKKIAQRLMDVADRDKDGLLTIAELEASFAEIIGHPLSHKMRKSVVTSFFEADSNLDGLLTMEEILAELAKYAE